MIWLYLTGLLVLALLLRALLERRTLDITHLTISIDPAIDPGGSTVKSGQALRIVHLSDLHAEYFFIRTEQLIEAIRQSQPDVIVFTGDLSGTVPAAARGTAILTHLHRHPSFASIPFYAVGGNHDNPEALDLLRYHGIRVLDNEHDVFFAHGKRWQVVGLEDLRQGQPDLTRALSQPAIRADIPDQRRIILAHNPDTLLRFPASRAALWLSGHLHGGQIWAPFRLEYMMLRQEKLPRQGVTRGLHRIGEQHIYISRGLGCVAIPLRLFSLPELAILDLSISSEEKEPVCE